MVAYVSVCWASCGDSSPQIVFKKNLQKGGFFILNYFLTWGGVITLYLSSDLWDYSWFYFLIATFEALNAFFNLVSYTLQSRYGKLDFSPPGQLTGAGPSTGAGVEPSHRMDFGVSFGGAQTVCIARGSSSSFSEYFIDDSFLSGSPFSGATSSSSGARSADGDTFGVALSVRTSPSDLEARHADADTSGVASSIRSNSGSSCDSSVGKQVCRVSTL